MIEARNLHTATLLQDGKVLVAGGAMHMDYAGIWGPSGWLASAEVFDPGSRD
jgi:hypothetical protein